MPCALAACAMTAFMRRECSRQLLSACVELLRFAPQEAVQLLYDLFDWFMQHLVLVQRAASCRTAYPLCVNSSVGVKRIPVILASTTRCRNASLTTSSTLRPLIRNTLRPPIACGFKTSLRTST